MLKKYVQHFYTKVKTQNLKHFLYLTEFIIKPYTISLFNQNLHK